MPAMMELQLRNHCLNVAGAAHSYGIITLNLMALGGGDCVLPIITVSRVYSALRSAQHSIY